jgi:hypothetical protein
MPADSEAYIRELAEILANPQYGADKEARQKSLDTATQAAQILNWASVAIGAANILLWSLRPVTSPGLLALPWAGFVLLLRCPVIQTFRRTRKGVINAYPSIEIPFLVPLIGILISETHFGHLVSAIPVFRAAVVPGVLVSFVFMWFLPATRKGVGRCLIFSCFGICYAAATITFTNSFFDDSSPTVYRSEVVNRYTQRGNKGGVTYYLVLSPWMGQPESSGQGVSQQFFESHQVGDVATVLLHNGRLGFPWYVIR